MAVWKMRLAMRDLISYSSSANSMPTNTLSSAMRTTLYISVLTMMRRQSIDSKNCLKNFSPTKALSAMPLAGL